MSRLLIVPAKPLARAKQRLGDALSAAQRRELVLAMLADVSAVAASCGETWVLCSDAEAADVAARTGAAAMHDETPDAGLNPSLRRAIRRAVAQGRTSVVIVASDVPCVTAEDVNAIVAAGSACGVAIAPSDDGTGTNALYVAPPELIAPSFGPDSRAAHEAAAKAAGAEAAIVQRARVALDVDGVEDLRRVREITPGPSTAAFLEQLGW